jgi:hypothetical protein
MSASAISSARSYGRVNGLQFGSTPVAGEAAVGAPVRRLAGRWTNTCRARTAFTYDQIQRCRAFCPRQTSANPTRELRTRDYKQTSRFRHAEDMNSRRLVRRGTLARTRIPRIGNCRLRYSTPSNDLAGGAAQHVDAASDPAFCLCLAFFVLARSVNPGEREKVPLRWPNDLAAPLAASRRAHIRRLDDHARHSLSKIDP